MVRIATAPELPMLRLDPTASEPLYRQIYDALRVAILAGQIAPGTRLPASRALAQDLGVARNTVVNAFAQLIAEGYIVGQIGAGTSVAHNLPDDLLTARQRLSPPIALPRDGRAISQRGQLLAATPVAVLHEPRPLQPFRSGVPALDAFPADLWAQLTARVLRTVPPEMLSYGEAAGHRPLRAAIADYLGAARAVRCSPDQIIIVSGSQQGLDLAARVLLDPDDAVWMEDPGYLGARAALIGAGAQLVPVPVDDEGIAVTAGVNLNPAARLAYVSPSHHYPLGVTMSLARRLALLDWARQANAWILEDDYDSEYRYAGRPLAALQGLDQHARVIYIGTFSKVLFPALRLGYLVVPPDLVAPFVAARAIADRHAPTIDQAVLAAFITEGHFGRHIRRMRLLYANRQAALWDAARQHLGGMLDLVPAAAGMHLLGWLPDRADDVALARIIARQGVTVQPISQSYHAYAPRSGFVLGYAAYDAAAIQQATRQLAAILRHELRR